MYLSARMFAAEVGLSYGHVNRLCQSGDLPYLSCGRKRMIDVETGRAALSRLAGEETEKRKAALPKFTVTDFRAGLEQLRAGC